LATIDEDSARDGIRSIEGLAESDGTLSAKARPRRFGKVDELIA
jgi:hypothetical protein